jgi:hypothetical protein
MTKVINMKDRRGVVPDGAVYIGRASGRVGLAASKWKNPHPLEVYGRAKAIALYEDDLRQRPDLLGALDELRGRDLACWCSPSPCHGDLLLRLANATPQERLAWLAESTAIE